jgi:hypothetical protein
MKQVNVQFIYPAINNIQGDVDMNNYHPCHKDMFNQVADFIAKPQKQLHNWKRYTQCMADLFSGSVNSYKVSLYQT